MQTGLFHNFFDDSPIMNTDYPNNAKKPFNGLLINSVGIQYERKIHRNGVLMIGYESFRESYDKHSNMYPIKEPIVGNRFFSTFRINYYRFIPFKPNLNFIYGGGINFRHGSEEIIITRGVIGYFNNDPNIPIYELMVENLIRNDPGLNVFAGIDYTPINWLTLSAKIDFLSSIRINDKDGMEEMKEAYDSPQFPTRYDLSFNLGVGFNF